MKPQTPPRKKVFSAGKQKENSPVGKRTRSKTKPSVSKWVQAQRQELQTISGQTPHARKHRFRKKEYKDVTDREEVAKHLVRITTCCLCGSDGANILEHCHYTGLYRGNTCQRCNNRDGRAAKSARKNWGIDKDDYEIKKCSLPKGYWEFYGSELAKRIDNLTPEEGYRYVTGKTWREDLLPYAKEAN